MTPPSEILPSLKARRVGGGTSIFSGVAVERTSRDCREVAEEASLRSISEVELEPAAARAAWSVCASSITRGDSIRADQMGRRLAKFVAWEGITTSVI